MLTHMGLSTLELFLLCFILSTISPKKKCIHERLCNHVPIVFFFCIKGTAMLHEPDHIICSYFQIKIDFTICNLTLRGRTVNWTIDLYSMIGLVYIVDLFHLVKQKRKETTKKNTKFSFYVIRRSAGCFMARDTWIFKIVKHAIKWEIWTFKLEFVES